MKARAKRKAPASHTLYTQWIERAGLEKIANWASEGCTMPELANNMGITKTTLYEWCRRFPDIQDAIKKGRAMSCECVENALFRSALGMAEEVTDTEETITNRDGTKAVRTRHTVTRLAPSVTAQIFYLKTRAGWSEKRPEVPEEGVPDDPFSAALVELAHSLDSRSDRS
jgi:hypothetical protein